MIEKMKVMEALEVVPVAIGKWNVPFLAAALGTVRLHEEIPDQMTEWVEPTPRDSRAQCVVISPRDKGGVCDLTRRAVAILTPQAIAGAVLILAANALVEILSARKK